MQETNPTKGKDTVVTAKYFKGIPRARVLDPALGEEENMSKARINQIRYIDRICRLRL